MVSKIEDQVSIAVYLESMVVEMTRLRCCVCVLNGYEERNDSVGPLIA